MPIFLLSWGAIPSSVSAGRESSPGENFQIPPSSPQCAENAESDQCTLVPAKKCQVHSTQDRGTEGPGMSQAQPAFAEYIGEKHSLRQKSFDNIWPQGLHSLF